MTRPARLLWKIGLALALGGCAAPDTSRLAPARDSALVAEGVRFRAANLTFRFTDDAGGENRIASIVVTDRTVLIHKNDKVGIEITPASRRVYQVNREAERVRITAGSGRGREVWSFVPPSDAPGWTDAIRAVIRNSAGAR